MNFAESLVRTLVVNGVDRPDLGWVALAGDHGVEDGRVTGVDELARDRQRVFLRRAPYLVELVL